MKKTWLLAAVGFVIAAVPVGLLARRPAGATGTGRLLIKSFSVLAYDTELVVTGPGDARAFGA